VHGKGNEYGIGLTRWCSAIW